MKKYLFISHLSCLALISSLACLVLSCGGTTPDEPTSVGPEQPVTPDNPEVVERPLGFAPSTDKESESSSRADGYVPLENKYFLFKVWVYKSMPDPEEEEPQTVMPGYQVKFLGAIDRWQYDGNTFASHSELDSQFLKFWDASAEKYAFHAYAPVAEGDGVTASPKGLTIPGTVEAHKSEKDMPENLKNLVIARHTRNFAITQLGLCDVDELSTKRFPSINTFAAEVPLRFHHLFSKVEFRIFNASKDTPATVKNLKVALNKKLGASGTYTDGQWTSLTLGNYLFLEGPEEISLPISTSPNPKDDAISVAPPTIELPQAFPIDKESPFQMQILMEVNGQEVNGSFTIEGGWEDDIYYIYYIRIDATDTDIILIDLEVADFAYGGAKDYEQTNW